MTTEIGNSIGDILAAAPVGYGPIVVVILVAMAAGLAILLLTHYLPKAGRQGPRKDAPYESGMPVIGDARRRFNVRFYLVAMMFLLFDVELVFMYPLGLVLKDNADRLSAAGAAGNAALASNQHFLFAVLALFFVILLLGLAYDWAKGVFRWD